MLPLALPAPVLARPLATTAVCDISQTVATFGAKWTAGTTDFQVGFDTLSADGTRVGDVVEGFRRHLGGPPPLFAIPLWMLRFGALWGDLVARLGWSPPVRSTALAELSRGVTGAPAPWIAATGISPLTLPQALARQPATIADKWFARLYLLKPLVFGGLALFWLLSGLVALTVAFEPATAILHGAGLPLPLAQALTVVTSLADIAIGLAIAVRRTTSLGNLCGILLSLAYMGGALVLTPDLWLDPLGPLVKTGPAILLMLVALAIVDDRRERARRAAGRFDTPRPAAIVAAHPTRGDSMAIPPALHGRLRLPAIAAPMFLASGPDLVTEVCRSGLIGSFPALNQRTSAGYGDWLSRIEDRLAGVVAPAPFGVNLIVHRSNSRLATDLEVTVRHRVPLVITSLGVQPEIVAAVQAYGGLVFHDVVNRRHAERAAAAKVDGIICVAAGAGGHGGTLSPFALLSEVAEIFDGALILAGAIGSGRQIAAARLMGADLAYLGSRFIATREAMVSDEQKAMMLAARANDIVHTAAVTGVGANFLRTSLLAQGLDADALPANGTLDLQDEAKAWKTLWSAGQGVGSISDVPGAAALCERLIAEYRAAMADAAADPFGSASPV